MPLFFGLLCVAGGVSLVAQADEANNPLLRFLLQEDDETSDSDEAKDESDKPEHPESDKKEDFTMEKSGESPEAQGNKKSDLPLPPTADEKKGNEAKDEEKSQKAESSSAHAEVHKMPSPGTSLVLDVKKDTWVRVEDVPEGKLQIGLHAAQGELPSVELFAEAEQEKEKQQIGPLDSSVSYTAQGLGETQLTQYQIERKGTYAVHIIPGDGTRDEYLVLIGRAPEPRKTVTPPVGAVTVISSGDDKRDLSSFLPILIILLVLALMVVVGVIGEKCLLHPRKGCRTDHGLNAVPTNGSGESFVLQITADGRTIRLDLNPERLRLKPLTIGRSSSCYISLEDKQVSSSHAEIGVHGGRICLRDLFSTNGTYVNNRRLTSGESVILQAGDQIRIASARLQIFHH